MPYIHSVATSLAPHYYDQDALISALMGQWAERYHNPKRIEAFQRNVLVGGRHLAIPMDRYPALTGFGDANQAWIETAVPMARRAVVELLDGAGLTAADVSAITSTTVTLAVPSLKHAS